MGIVVIKGAEGHAARGKAESLIKIRTAQDKDGAAFDGFLRQGVSEQFRAYSLLLEFRLYRQRRQMQPTHLSPLIRERKADVGDYFIGMDADPIMDLFSMFVEVRNQPGFIVTLWKRGMQQCDSLGKSFSGYFSYFHDGNFTLSH